MNKYTIEYHYATYSGTHLAWADSQEQAIARMWCELLRDGGIGTAYQSARVISVEYDDDGE